MRLAGTIAVSSEITELWKSQILYLRHLVEFLTICCIAWSRIPISFHCVTSSFNAIRSGSMLFTKIFKNISTLQTANTNTVSMQCRCNELCFDNINIELNTVCQDLLYQANSAAGHDGIPGIFYKKMTHELSIPISIVFQQCIH